MVKCPKCGLEYEKITTNFESNGIIVSNVKAFACKKCGEEIFSQEQAAAIRKRIEALSPQVSLERKISSAAGHKPVVYLPNVILKSIGLKIGDTIKIGVEGKKRVVITPA